MNILVAVNSDYLRPLSVMLYSLSRYNKVHLNVFILHCNISKKSQCKFLKRINKFLKPIEIHFVKVKIEELPNIKSFGRFKREAVLRLLMIKKVPFNIDRILWLDADLIIQGNIQNLYSYPDHGQYALVCEDMFPKREKYQLLSQIGMAPNERYFNSGVMLFYMRNIRKDFDDMTFMKWMIENPDKLKYPDQNTLNICFKGKLSWAKPEIYNLQLSRIEKNKITKKNKIIHYNTKEKPWDDNYSGNGEYIFWMYGMRALGVKEGIMHFIRKYKKFSIKLE